MENVSDFQSYFSRPITLIKKNLNTINPLRCSDGDYFNDASMHIEADMRMSDKWIIPNL